LKPENVLLKLNKEETEEIQTRSVAVENIFKKIGHSAYNEQHAPRDKGILIDMKKMT